MKRGSLLSLAVGIVALTGASTPEEVQRAARQNGWLEDYPAARKAARAAGKPMFVVFRCAP